MPPESRKLLMDMTEAADVILTLASGKSEADYVSDRVMRDAIQWNFAVIGEALAALHHRDEAIAETISEWRKIVGFRNQLIHGYGSIRHDITWKIIVQKLPILRQELEALLKT
jgi:uncharacterized protein with HEPN domain